MAENRREEQKLWLIVFQIKAIRTRLNLLAIQFWIFMTAAVLIGAAVLIFVSALVLNPMLFLGVAILVVILTSGAAIRVVRAARHRAANQRRAATIADDRAALKGRLATVLALAETPPPSPLWPYLVEDTYALRQRFEPSKVEPRWVSRSIFAPLVACVVGVALLGVVRYQKRGPNNLVYAPPAELTADLGNLDIRPADPSVAANAQVFADPATLRQLAAKLAQAQKPETNRSGVSRWINKARQLAGSLQDRVTGQKPLAMPPLTLNLRGDKSQPPDNGPSPQAGDQSGNNPGDAPIMPPTGNPAASGGESQPPPAIPPDEADQLAQQGLPALPGDNSTGEPQDQAGPKVGSGYASESGSNHSAGSDPEHLFGPASPQALGSDSFKLTVDARPIDEASSGGAPAYLPPKVRVTLNSQQFPDEPLARTAVPVDDRLTIKRVFER